MKEILHIGCNEPTKVDVIAEELTPTISEVMSDWGLIGENET